MVPFFTLVVLQLVVYINKCMSTGTHFPLLLILVYCLKLWILLSILGLVFLKCDRDLVVNRLIFFLLIDWLICDYLCWAYWVGAPLLQHLFLHIQLKWPSTVMYLVFLHVRALSLILDPLLGRPCSFIQYLMSVSLVFHMSELLSHFSTLHQ